MGFHQGGGEESAVLQWLDFKLEVDLREVDGHKRQQLHVVRIAGADLDFETEAFGAIASARSFFAFWGG